MRDYLDSSKAYLIAETAYTFEGDKNYLLEQTKTLPKEVNAIKYHMLYNLDEYMVGEHSAYELISSWLLSERDWVETLTCAKGKNLDTLVLVDDKKSVEFCEKNYELIDAIEIHAACVNDIYLLEKAIGFAKKHNKVFVIGISGFEIQELSDIVDYIREKKIKDVLLMYGFQNFPTKIDEIKLKKIPALKRMFEFAVGYADHTVHSDPIKEHLINTALSLGANIQEVHYVIKEGEERTDYITGLDHKSLKRIKDNLEKTSKAIGKIDFRLNEGEKKYLSFRKVPVYTKSFKKGHILKKGDIVFKRIEKAKEQHRFGGENSYLGKKINCDVRVDSEIRL
ncbi:MAG: hypothetical protein COA82_09675 [Alkaliphilus sp.]|nr:MAG: hypothetical protein COA82_09675 [Alkaliphilus sp.]